MCQTEHVKPLFIVLATGNYVRQPMFTKVIESTNFEEAFSDIQNINNVFEKEGFKLVRIKSEVFSDDFYLFSDKKTEKFEPYFEYHCKININNFPLIENICTIHNAHLSKNSLDNSPYEKYITIREYSSNETFEQRIENLLLALNEHTIEIVKQKKEYCIYDSQLDLDKGWAFV